MLTATLPRNLTTLRSPSNLFYHRSGKHLDGLPRKRAQSLTRPSAHYRADRLGNPRWGLDYVVTTIGPSWEMGTEHKA